MGFLMLRTLAALRPLRRMTARYGEEQALIERWLRAVSDAAGRDLTLALEIALCGRIIKGYGETHRRAKASFLSPTTRISRISIPSDLSDFARTRALASRRKPFRISAPTIMMSASNFMIRKKS
jgi:indolepyruvate ferredoxin oxidoreductase beta subunit